MEKPDKIYIPEKLPKIFFSELKRSEDECIEYIRKDALIEWAKENIDSLGRLSYGEFIDKLNSL